MSIRKIGASNIFTGKGEILANHVITLDDGDRILDIQPLDMSDHSDVEFYYGWIIPGFINAHCHLELSHMKSVLPTGTGLIPFIRGIVTQREADEDTIQEAIAAADHEMYREGIVAVGDISNTTDSFRIKANSPITYYTFVEAFDLMQPADAQGAFDRAYTVYEAAPGHKALVPHAPYSCTPELLNKINAVNTGRNKTISIHNQETIHENNFFLEKTGELIDFYTSFGLTLDHFNAIQRTSIHYLLQYLDADQRHLLVHNTKTTLLDYKTAIDKLVPLYWATCANANLYIENQLPDYRMFLEEDANMTIGTDSLASNWGLSVWDELNTIKKYNSYIPNETLLKWSTYNGARALGLDDKFGIIAKGRTPGLLFIDSEERMEMLITPSNKPSRIL